MEAYFFSGLCSCSSLVGDSVSPFSRMASSVIVISSDSEGPGSDQETILLTPEKAFTPTKK